MKSEDDKVNELISSTIREMLNAFKPVFESDVINLRKMKILLIATSELIYHLKTLLNDMQVECSYTGLLQELKNIRTQIENHDLTPKEN